MDVIFSSDIPDVPLPPGPLPARCGQQKLNGKVVLNCGFLDARMSDPSAAVATMRSPLLADGEAGVEAVEEVARPEMTGMTGVAAAATGIVTGIAIADTETIMREEGEVVDAVVVEVTMATVSTTEVRMAVLRPRRIIAMEVLGHLAPRRIRTGNRMEGLRFHLHR